MDKRIYDAKIQELKDQQKKTKDLVRKEIIERQIRALKRGYKVGIEKKTAEDLAKEVFKDEIKS